MNLLYDRKDMCIQSGHFTILRNKEENMRNMPNSFEFPKSLLGYP